jgi:hypothetical protein
LPVAVSDAHHRLPGASGCKYIFDNGDVDALPATRHLVGLVCGGSLLQALDPDGPSSVAGAGSLPSGAVTISGNTISAVVSGSLLPSTGFNKLDYTWNLWARNVAFSGFAAIPDFAPDNANFTTTPGSVPVPEAETYLLMLAGLGLTGWMLRRRAAG